MPAAAETRALAERVIAAATAGGQRIAVAESLTGGMLAAALVDIPGASRVLSGAIVAYDTELKATLLGVDADLLAARGPVDRDVAAHMAVGVRRACAVAGAAADIGVATTGVAGPAADPQTGQPAGTVWIGVSSGGAADAVEYRFDGDRDAVRAHTVAAALGALLGALAANPRATEPGGLGAVS